MNHASYDRFIGEGPDEDTCFCGSGDPATGTCFMCGDPVCGDCIVEDADCFDEFDCYLGQHDVCPGCAEEMS